jgi:hypothetical protein
MTHNDSSRVIQKFYRGFIARQNFVRTLAISRKHQEANAGGHGWSAGFYNIMPFWADPVDGLADPCISFDTEVSTKHPTGTSLAGTDFRDRQEKPVYIAVKVVEAIVKKKYMASIIDTVSPSVLSSVENIYTEAIASVINNGSFKFADSHGTGVKTNHLHFLLEARMKVRFFGWIVRDTEPIHCTVTPIKVDDLEKLRITPAPTKLRLARTGPTTACGGIPISL